MLCGCQAGEGDEKSVKPGAAFHDFQVVLYDDLKYGCKIPATVVKVTKTGGRFVYDLDTGAREVEEGSLAQAPEHAEDCLPELQGLKKQMEIQTDQYTREEQEINNEIARTEKDIRTCNEQNKTEKERLVKELTDVGRKLEALEASRSDGKNSDLEKKKNDHKKVIDKLQSDLNQILSTPPKP